MGSGDMRTQRRISLLFAVLWAAALGAGCSSSSGGGPSVEVFFDSNLARAARESAVRVELYLVESCAGVSLGDRPVPDVASVTVIRDGETGSFGSSLTNGSFGLYGVAQDANCAVVAAGCVPVTIDDSTGTLAVTLGSFSGEGCPAPEVCSIETGNCGVGSGGTGGAGGAGGAGGQPVTRVEAGLIALYEFDEGGGTTVADQSGVSPSHDLTIADPRNVTWSTDHLSVDSATIFSTGSPATKIVSRAQASGALTMEAWIKPANDTQAGPARIVSMSLDPQVRNFMLGQEADTYAARFRADGEADWDNGSPTIFTTAGTAAPLLTHVVHTHAADGSEVLYVDGVEDTAFARTGGLSQWDATYPLVVANEATGDRDWLGELHLIAIYDRALDASEVDQNFAAGP